MPGTGNQLAFHATIAGRGLLDTTPGYRRPPASHTRLKNALDAWAATERKRFGKVVE